ncbi:MAG: hypothetical protein ACETWM_12790 [Candidatus Lokiarchaeia archaeon]
MQGRTFKAIFCVCFVVLFLSLGVGIIGLFSNVQVSDSISPLILVANQKQINELNTLEEYSKQGQVISPMSMIDMKMEDTMKSLSLDFNRWLMKNSTMSLTMMNNPSNETVAQLFFSFLRENPKQAKLFAEYDRLLSQKNRLQEQERQLEIEAEFQNINMIVEQGEIVREWSTVKIVNGTEVTSVYREYAMEINGTTQSVLKITVYSSDGTVISDPYIRISRTPLICWIWSWQWWWFALVPILYGYDVFAYSHFTYLEENIWFAWAINVPGNPTYSFIAGLISLFASIAYALLPIPIPEPFHKIAGAIAAFISAILMVVSFVPQKVAIDLFNKILVAKQQNVSVDPEWGFRFYEYVHYPVSPPTGAIWYYPPVPDVQPTIAWYYVTATGGIIGATPPFYDLPLPIDSITAYDLQYLYSTIANEYGCWDTWIWVGGIPGGPPPT